MIPPSPEFSAALAASNVRCCRCSIGGSLPPSREAGELLEQLDALRHDQQAFELRLIIESLQYGWAAVGRADNLPIIACPKCATPVELEDTAHAFRIAETMIVHVGHPASRN